MTLPRSFMADGFVTAQQAVHGGRKFRRLMIGTEGLTDTGKTEFILSCPGPGIIICMDRNFDAMLDNPNPPASRRDDFAFKVISAPLSTSAAQDEYVKYFTDYRTQLYKAIANADARTVAIDGDSDSWELERLAAHGKLTGVFPQTRYTDVYARRRAMIAKLWDSGKIIIATNKMKAEYKTIRDRDGNVILDDKGEEKREKTGEFERQGFPDQNYLWQIQLRHLRRPAGVNPKTKKAYPQSWGIKILKCKANTEMEGAELWGADCCFPSLVEFVYPNIQPAEWGL